MAILRRFFAHLVLLGAAFTPRAASAQQATFHLDRLEVPGAPDDGVVLFRPKTRSGVENGVPRTLVYGQLALGYSLNPLRVRHITSNAQAIRNSDTGSIAHQLGNYFSGGIQLLDRLSIGLTLPVVWYQDGRNPNYPPGVGITYFQAGGPASGDLRLDFRYIALRSSDQRGAVGVQASVFAPFGNTANFGGDGQMTLLPMLSGEYTFGKAFTLVGNTGVHFRPINSINTPINGNGLGISTEWRWAIGGLVHLKGGKFRLGGTVFGQTGIDNGSAIAGDTFFVGKNTPVEFQGEARMRFGGGEEPWWVGLSAGSRLLNGYGAPDFRTVAMIGSYFPILESGAISPTRRSLSRTGRGGVDTDHDGLPDEIDACPTEPEDHKDPDPNDGCPVPLDRDGDGIPDNLDKCPDQPEDKDGIDDGDGCPDDDSDKDGIPDVRDACPKEPGRPTQDPGTNGCPSSIKWDGTKIRILQQVHFATGSAQILADSFPMLEEIAALLKVNPSIKRVQIEGHTDNVGGAAMNLGLSRGRAASVRMWLVAHGVEPHRLTSEGYGLAKPIADNNTAEGRATNRRVEFNIVEEEDTNKPNK